MSGFDDERLSSRALVRAVDPGSLASRGRYTIRRPFLSFLERTFRVFTPDGQLLGAVPTAFDADARAYWGRDLVHAIVEDSVSGLPELRIYRIVRDVPGGRH